MFTIRQDSPQHLPPEIRSAARSAWVAASSYTNSLLGSVAQTLDLPPEALTQYSEPGLEMTETRQATMMRLFRYECQNEKVVSERKINSTIHSTPGLCWNRTHRSWLAKPGLWRTARIRSLGPIHTILLPNRTHLPAWKESNSYGGEYSGQINKLEVYPWWTPSCVISTSRCRNAL